MAGKVAGTCYVKADGEQFDISGAVEAPIMEVMREGVVGVNGPAGYKETVQEPYIKLTGIFTKDFPVEKLQSSTEMTVTAEWPNGKVYTLSGAYIRGELVANSEDGTVSIEFGGKRGQWL